MCLYLVSIYGLFDYAIRSDYVTSNDSMITNRKHREQNSCLVTGGTAVASFRRYRCKSQNY